MSKLEIFILAMAIYSIYLFEKNRMQRKIDSIENKFTQLSDRVANIQDQINKKCSESLIKRKKH